MVRSADTSPGAWQVQRDIFRRMTGPERIAMAVEMSEAARGVAAAGIRYRHPRWSDEEVHDALLAGLLGARLANEVRRSRLVPA